MVTRECRDGNLILKDFRNREITIPQKRYLELILDDEKFQVSRLLDECLKEPSEVWFNKETIDDTDYFILNI